MKMDVLFVDPNFLKGRVVVATDDRWVNTSRRRLTEVKQFATDCQRDYQSRLEFRARIYRNLPHWHGWLLNDEHLFLGRTDWEYKFDQPHLRVGQNKYRHFDMSNKEGQERIELFKSWQKYYFDHKSTLVCDSTKPVA